MGETPPNHHCRGLDHPPAPPSGQRIGCWPPWACSNGWARPSNGIFEKKAKIWSVLATCMLSKFGHTPRDRAPPYFPGLSASPPCQHAPRHNTCQACGAALWAMPAVSLKMSTFFLLYQPVVCCWPLAKPWHDHSNRSASVAPWGVSPCPKPILRLPPPIGLANNWTNILVIKKIHSGKSYRPTTLWLIILLTILYDFGQTHLVLGLIGLWIVDLT